MKLKTITSIVLIFFVIPVWSQKNVNIDFKSVNKDISFQPTINELTKDAKYYFELPSVLTYHKNSAEIANSIYFDIVAIGIRAKYNSAQPDYIFSIQTPGIQNLNVQPARWYRDGVGQRGFVKDIGYSFPCTLVVKKKEDKEFKVLRVIEIFRKDEVFTVTYNSAFLTDGFTPFTTQGGLDSSYNFNQQTILKTIENRIARDAYYKVTTAINYLFDEEKTGKLTYSYAHVKEKKRTFDFSDTDTLGMQYRAALDNYFAGNKPEALKQFNAIVTGYETLLKSQDARIDNNVKDMIMYNLSCCNMFLGDFAKSWEYFNNTTMKGIGEGDYYKRELKGLLNMYQFRSHIESLNVNK